MKSQQNKSFEEIFWSKPIIFIFSLLIAVLIWLFVADPVKTITFNVPVTTQGINSANVIENKDIVLVNNNIPKYIELTLKGRQSAINKVVKQNFSSIIDFSSIDSEEISTFQIPEPEYDGNLQGVLISDYSPKNFGVDLDDLGDMVLDINVKKIGNPAQDFIVNDIILSPTSIQLSGGTSILEKAKNAQISVDISGLKESEEKKFYVKVLDDEGKEVKGTEKKYKTTVKVEIAKRLDVVPDTVGDLEEGFGYSSSSIKVKPQYVYVIAQENAKLESINKIYTKPINISKMTNTAIVSADLVVPEGYVLVDQNKRMVKVTIPIDGLKTKSFEIKSKDISFLNASSNLDYSFIKSKVKVNIRGPESLINRLKISSLNPRIDVANYTNGTFVTPLIISLPIDCEMLGNADVEMTVKEEMLNEELLAP